MDASRKRGRSDAAPNGIGKGTADSKRMKEKESFQTGIGSKSKPCTKFFSMAGCPFGEGCHFLHYFAGGVKVVSQMTNLGGNHPGVASRMPTEGPPAAAIKTRICTNYGTAEGCKYGDKCRFAHGERELQRPIPLIPQAAAASLAAPAAPATSFGASATAKISVDASLVSAIIGKGGMNTKQICRVTGAKLAIRDHDSDPKLRNVELEGTFDQIKQASTMVRELAAQFGSSTASAAAPPPAAGAAPPTKAPPGGNLKTKLCDNFTKGSCTFGDRCHFAHGAGELRKAAAA